MREGGLPVALRSPRQVLKDHQSLRSRRFGSDSLSLPEDSLQTSLSTPAQTRQTNFNPRASENIIKKVNLFPQKHTVLCSLHILLSVCKDKRYANISTDRQQLLCLWSLQLNSGLCCPVPSLLKDKRAKKNFNSERRAEGSKTLRRCWIHSEQECGPGRSRT